MITLLSKTVAFRPILTDQNSDAPDAVSWTASCSQAAST